MASVSSLDKDLRALRLDKYTPQRAKEVRKWIEDTLGEQLAPGDLLEALKDGTALCKLINLATPGGVRFKASPAPFVQMENISHFLRACQSPPLSLPAHDCFLTVDLYESKDPAQVLQCIEAFSRRAAAVDPIRIPHGVGGRKAVSPQGTGRSSPSNAARPRGGSNASEASSAAGGGRTSPFKPGATSPTAASSWAARTDIGATAPAWNINQYGWTGGASQGNQGIMFGGRRQIVSNSPKVPTLADKEKMRREQAEEENRLRAEAEEAKLRKRREIEAEEEQAKIEEEKRWADETRKLREKEKLESEAEKRRWEEEERRWQLDEEKRVQEEKELEARFARDRQQKKLGGDARLQGQFLSQYQAEQNASSAAAAAKSSESDRIKELERQLEEAKERERKYERERQERVKQDTPEPLAVRRQETPSEPSSSLLEEDSIQEDRDFLRKEWAAHHETPPRQPPRQQVPQQRETPPPPQPPRAQQQQTPQRPLPVPQTASAPGTSPRPLPNPQSYKPAPPSIPSSSTKVTPPANRFPAAVAASTIHKLPPSPSPSPQTQPAPPAQAPAPAPAPAPAAAAASSPLAPRPAAASRPPAAMSLLEREMERERERQREWEEGQRATQRAVEEGRVDRGEGSGPGQSWDVNSYGFTGGDNMNRGNVGVYGGPRRQILGPRPMGGK